MGNKDTLSKISIAMEHVLRLCDGSEKWTMRIPVNEEKDSDCIIINALDAAEKTIKEQQDLIERFLHSITMLGCAIDGNHRYALSYKSHGIIREMITVGNQREDGE